MNLTSFQGFLAALADSRFSAAFYVAAAYQLGVLGLGCFPGVRRARWYAAAAAVSHLLLSVFLLAGWYYATRPVA
ncbi:hypothetical protein IA69_25840 [Massilia sp. JS1662]|nr:hypothetical protein [Massilia sp. JS1662]KGF79154.1 hypothetical protein IA69_25840 [Massilia sp. JS1662]